MEKLTPKLRREGQRLSIWCTGCAAPHTFDLGAKVPGKDANYRWNGNMALPTFSPALRVDGPGRKVCRFYVQQGRIEYLRESTHAFAGQIMGLASFPERAQ